MEEQKKYGLGKRDLSRRQRYAERQKSAKIFPVSIATVSFMHEGNLGYVLRAAACFGAKCVKVIGSIPDYRALRAYSGSVNTFVQLQQFKNTQDFLENIRINQINLVSLELIEGAIPIREYAFDYNKETCLVIGHEEAGVPTEVLVNSDVVYIPMHGVQFCLNAAQTANVALYEYTNRA